MSYIDIKTARAFCNVSFTDDDLLFSKLIEAAESAITNHIDCPVSTYQDETGKIPADLELAILTLVSTWYSNRESISYGTPNKIPYTLEYLLQPYKKYTRN